jgi:hypothetical protein
MTGHEEQEGDRRWLVAAALIGMLIWVVIWKALAGVSL